MANSTVGIRLDEHTQNRLKKLGARRDRSPHYLMKEAVEHYLEQEEAIEAERDLILARWEKYELTGETISHAEMKSWAKTLSKTSKSIE